MQWPPGTHSKDTRPHPSWGRGEEEGVRCPFVEPWSLGVMFLTHTHTTHTHYTNTYKQAGGEGEEGKSGVGEGG